MEIDLTKWRLTTKKKKINGGRKISDDCEYSIKDLSKVVLI